MEKKNKKISICVLIANYDSPGGLQRQANLLVDQLSLRSIPAYILTRNQEKLQTYEKKNYAHIYRFPPFTKFRAISSFFYIITSIFWLFLNYRKYQIIHCHQSYSPATIGVLVKLFIKKPVMVKVSGSNEYGEVSEIKKLPFSRIRIYLLKKVDRFIILNEGMRKELTSIGINHKRIELIPNGVVIPHQSAYDDAAKKLHREKLHFSEDKLIVIYSGRLTEGKGLEILIEIWKEIIGVENKALLLIAGAGCKFRSIEAKIKERAELLGILHSVYFLGHVSNIVEYLLSADIFVLPSVSEGMSNAILEAMACGLAVVSTKIEANAELIVDKFNGLLIERQNADELKNVLLALISNADLRKSLGKNAKNTILRDYSLERITSRYIAMYNELTQEQKR